MTDEWLARWLRETTPEPPPGFTFDRLPVPRRTWTPLVAAACVLAVLAVGIGAVTLRAGHHHDAALPAHSSSPLGAAPSVTATPSTTTPVTSPPSPASPTASSTTPPSATATPTLRLPWRARELATGNLEPLSLVSDGTHLFAIQRVGTIEAVVRIAPDGRVAARLQFAGEQPDSALVVAAGELWFVADNAASSHLLGLSIDDLTVRHSIAISRSMTAIAASGDTVYVGGGPTVLRVDAATGWVVDRFPFAGKQIAALAAYATKVAVGISGPFNPGPGEVLITQNGTIEQSIRTTGTIESLALSASGVWVVSTGGHAAGALYHRFDDPTRQVDIGFDYNPGPTVTVEQTTVWVGGSQVLSCADPASGATRAHVLLDTGRRSGYDAVLAIVSTASHVYATATDFSTSVSRLVELHPPKACG